MKVQSGYINDSNRNKTFRNIAIVFLVALVLVVPVFTVVKTINYNMYMDVISEFGSESETAKAFNQFEISGAIYSFNCILCVLSIIVQLVYWAPILKESLLNKKVSIKEKLAKNWPVILLAIFMAWTSVGCIQAGMEANAEKYVKNHSSGDSEYEYYLGIANWSSTDRMSNSADRSWNGCNNLKDGYFSFMFYATVMLNVLMLGNEAEDKKKWIIRVFMVSSFIIGFINILCFFNPIFLKNIVDWKRYTFNNSNHFAYYFSVVTIMSVVMFMKEENIFFKVLAFLNTINYFFIMIMNNTFGGQIGIGFAMLFILIVSLIRLVSRHKVKEFILFLVTLVFFIYSCTCLSYFESKRYVKDKSEFSVTSFRFTFLGNSYQFYRNSLTEDEANELKIQNTTINGKPVAWGTAINKLDYNPTSNVIYNIKELMVDAESIFKYFKPNSSDTSSGESLSGEEKDNSLKVQDSGEEISGNAETKDISSIGSGRGPVWIRSLDLMNQRPLFGWGLENLLNEFYQQYNIGEGRTHNLLLQLGGCTGIPGVLMYFVAILAIFFKSIYDVKLRRFGKTGIIIVSIVFVVSTILLNLIIHKVTDKLLFNGIFTVMMWAFLYMVIFFKNVRLRVKDWNFFEYIGAAVFVSYVSSALVGNSAFYTSPYFMIFLGILLYEVLHKTPRFETELAEEGPKSEIIEKKENVEKIEEVKEEREVKEVKDNNQKKSNKNKKKKRR